MLQVSFNRLHSLPRVLVAQSLVGREGLNLHRACRIVVLLHPEWNPGVVEQQIGRVDRVGSHWEVSLGKAIAEGRGADALPRIEVLPVIFRGTYDEQSWAVLRRRWDDLRAFAEDLAIRERLRLHLGDQPIYELRSLGEQAGVHCFYGDIPSRPGRTLCIRPGSGPLHPDQPEAPARAPPLDPGPRIRSLSRRSTQARRGRRRGAQAQAGLRAFRRHLRGSAADAYVREAISEGVLARFLRTDRVTAREIIEATLTSQDLDADGQPCAVRIPDQLSLFDIAS